MLYNMFIFKIYLLTLSAMVVRLFSLLIADSLFGIRLEGR